MGTDNEETWVEIQDDTGKVFAMRLLGKVHYCDKDYYILGSDNEEDENGTHSLMLIRQDQTVDGAEEYILERDESEIAQVMMRFIVGAAEVISGLKEAAEEVSFDLEDAEDVEEPDFDLASGQTCPCGQEHRPGEYCVCGQPELLQ